MSPDQFERFSKSFTMHHTTLGPSCPPDGCAPMNQFDIIGCKVSVIPSQANVKDAFPRVLAMGGKGQALDDIGRLTSLAHERQLARDLFF